MVYFHSPWNSARLRLMVAISASETTMPLGYWPVSSSQRTVRPVLVVVAEINSTMARSLTSGWARQFWLMKEKSRCSILFHLLVPGGRWLTTMSRPSSLASFCSSRFHSRTREPLLPPPAAVLRVGAAVGYGARARLSHHWRMLFTAKAAVSWSTPTLTHPAFAAKSYWTSTALWRKSSRFNGLRTNAVVLAPRRQCRGRVRRPAAGEGGGGPEGWGAGGRQ